MIEQIQQTLFLIVVVALLVNWVITRTFYDYRDPPILYMAIFMMLIVFGTASYFGITFYRIWV